jgi:2-methylcitrate dehydratase PrpD
MPLTNGHSKSNGVASTAASTVPEPVTKAIASFAASLTYDSIPPALISHLKVLILDYIGVSLFGSTKTESSEPFYAAIRSLNSTSSGKSTVFSHGSTFQPQYAMLLNGAYGHTLDFDDTHLGGVVHPGVTVISAALTEAETLNSSGEQLLTAIAAGYEVICRLGVALGSGGFAKGYHNTSTCGIFGAIAVIANLRGLSAEMTEMAFGIGISKTAGCMQYLANGAWNKRLHPGFAAHDAYLAVAFAQAGVVSCLTSLYAEVGVY